MTLDLGLRHEYYTPFVGHRGGRAGSRTTIRSPTSCWCRATATSPTTSASKSNWRNFNPRTGLSYRLDDRQVVRAGYGVSTIPFGDNTYAFNFPVKQNNQFNAANAFIPPPGISMAGGFPAPVGGADPVERPASTPGADARLRNGAYFYFPTDLKEGLLHSWNVAYQRELGGNFTAEVAYVANHGQDIIQRLDLNAGYTLGAGNAGRPQFAQFGRTSSVTAFLPYHTDYHSMQVKVDRRFRNGFLITNSYTLGKGESYDGGDTNGGISTPIDIERSWGRTANDRQAHLRQQLRLRPAVPEGRLCSAAIANGWQISGIFTAQSGIALDITMDGALLNTPGNTQRPNMIGDAEILGNVGGGQTWFDTVGVRRAGGRTRSAT